MLLFFFSNKQTLVFSMYTDICVYTLREFLKSRVWVSSVLHFCTVAVAFCDICVARWDIVFFSGRQKRLSSGATADTTVGLGGVVNHNHGGVHS